jgi:hypothetical protein
MYIIDKSVSIAEKLMPQIYNTSVNRNWHFAFTYKRKKLLTIGFNNMKTESAKVLKFVRRFNTKQQYLHRHAEIDAISRLWGRIYIDERITFVLVRLNRFLQLGDSKPCQYCQPVLDALGIDDVYWSNSDGSFQSKNEKPYKIY